MPPATRPLGFEKLEDRTTPTMFGNPWPTADHITVSFAPDGTDVGGASGTLFTALKGLGTATWQAEAERAFQTWAAVTNVNFDVVADGGQAFGTGGPVQGNPNFGDIRISARPLSDNVIAVTNPFDAMNSWAGEIVLNSDKQFSKGASAGKYDLYTVLLQEAGHALGLDNSGDTASAMYTTYSAPRTGLATADVTAVQAQYGVREADALDAAKSNGSLSTATPLTFVTAAATQLAGTDGTTGSAPLVAAGDLTTRTDEDNYTVRTPAGATSLTVAFQTNGLSLLNARLRVFDPDGNRLRSVTATPPADGGPFLLTLTGVKGDATYRIRVDKAADDVFAVGRYELAVGAAGEAAAAVAATPAFAFDTPTGRVNAADGNDFYFGAPSSHPAVDLGDAKAGADARWEFTGTSAINKAFDTDVFKLRTTADSPPVLVASVWATADSTLLPVVTVTDASGKPVAAEVLQNDGGVYTVQIRGVKASTDYLVWVRAANAFDSKANVGGYALGLDVRATAIDLQTFAAGTLKTGANQVFTSFTLTRSQSVWFDLSGGTNFGVAAGLVVYDAAGKPVLALASKYGRLAGESVFLQPGTYTVRIVAAAYKGGTLSGWDFKARFSLESDPIGTSLIAAPAPGGSTVTVDATVAPPTSYTVDPATGALMPFAGTGSVYTSPVGPTSTVTPIVWVAAPPLAVVVIALADVFSNPWGF